MNWLRSHPKTSDYEKRSSAKTTERDIQKLRIRLRHQSAKGDNQIDPVMILFINIEGIIYVKIKILMNTSTSVIFVLDSEILIFCELSFKTRMNIYINS